MAFVFAFLAGASLMKKRTGGIFNMRKTGLLVCLAALACGLFAVHATGTINYEADCVAAEDFTLDFNLGGLYSGDTDLVDNTANIGGVASLSFSVLDVEGASYAPSPTKYFAKDGGIRFYAANVMSFAMNEGLFLNSIEFTKYGNYSWGSKMVVKSSSDFTINDDDLSYQIVFDSPVSSFTLQNGEGLSDGQVRFDSINLVYSTDSEGGSSDDTNNPSLDNQWTDVLDYQSLALEGSYEDRNVTIGRTSYRSNARLNTKGIQIRATKDESGIISTEVVAGARISSVSITWAENGSDKLNGNSDTVTVYGSNVVPSLSDTSFEKTELFKSVFGSSTPEVSTTYTVSGDYNYFSLYASGALLLRSVAITWELPSEGSTPEADAEQWAETFLSKENGIVCDPNGLQMPDADKWMELGLLYLDLSDEAQNVLQAAEANELGSVVEQAVARYDYIVAKYNPENDPSSDYENYMGREVGPMAAFAGQGLNNESGINVAIFAAFAGISLTAGLGYFFYRKRKQA